MGDATPYSKYYSETKKQVQLMFFKIQHSYFQWDEFVYKFFEATDFPSDLAAPASTCCMSCNP